MGRFAQRINYIKRIVHDKWLPVDSTFSPVSSIERAALSKWALT